MASCNRSKVSKTNPSTSSTARERKCSPQTITEYESRSETDARSRLFSSNCPIRCGTSGYSYKKLVDISNFAAIQYLL